jgi:membrane protease YdiL (CAAX protease family)
MILGAIGPLLAGLTLTRIVDGKGSVIALLARLKRWRVGWLWLALLIPYGLTILLYLLPVAAGVAPATAILANIGPAIGLGLYAGFFEEMGWSGFMLPNVQRRFNPLIAALLVGLFWGGVWHLYADYIGAFGNLGWWGVLLVILQAPILLTAQRILLAWVYNRTKGSLLLCVLFHMCISSSAFLLVVNYPSNAVYVLWAVLIDLVWWVAAGAVILLDRGWWAAQKPQQDKMVEVAHAA